MSGQDIRTLQAGKQEDAVAVRTQGAQTNGAVHSEDAARDVFTNAVGNDAMALFKTYLEVEREQRASAPMQSLALVPPAQASQLVELLAKLTTPKPAPKLWLSLDDASEFSGLPRAYIAELAASGKLTGVKRGSWFIHRASLEAFAGE